MLRPRFALPIWVAALATVPLCSALGGTAELLAKGASALATGDLATAGDAFGAAAKADGESSVAPVGVGAVALFSGDFVGARIGFTRALTLSPGLAPAHIGLGTVLCQTGDFRGALEEFRGALAGARRPARVLAAEAYAACALGLYDTALEQARAALGTDPADPLARYVQAAAALARGDPRLAAELDAAPLEASAGVVRPVALASCLLSPGMAYWNALRPAGASPGASPAALPPLQRGAEVPPTLATHSEEGFRLVRPRQGEVLQGAVVVELEVAADKPLDYVVLFVDDTFAGHSAVRPFKFAVDTRLHPDGLTELRAEGYDAQARVVARASTVVLVKNDNRTLAPEEQAAADATSELLEELLLPPLAPLAAEQLAGHGWMGLGRYEAAASAFESAYAHNAGLPGLRDDLIRAYHSLGLDSRPMAPEIQTLAPERKAVALTFDDGPHPLITPWILDQLDREGVSATFFVVGKQATLYPELVREIIRRGHALGSHSYAHYSFRHFSPLESEQDLVKSRLAIREACGETVSLFRPPGGYYDSTVRAAAGALGFTSVFWTCAITSYPGAEGKRIAVALARQCAEGGIILLHNGEDETLDALPHLIPELRKHGVRFVTLSSAKATLPAGGKASARRD